MARKSSARKRAARPAAPAPRVCTVTTAFDCVVGLDQHGTRFEPGAYVVNETATRAADLAPGECARDVARVAQETGWGTVSGENPTP